MMNSGGSYVGKHGHVSAVCTVAPLRYAQNKTTNIQGGFFADNGQSMGFSHFQTYGTTAAELREIDPEMRIALIDIDVHHGNGDEDTFYR
jgi:acetoin utilization deacetylase AcuC-like enzyme